MAYLGPGRPSFDEILQAGSIHSTSPSWDALGRFLRRPWFSRIWVVQEVAVGKNPVFICGNRGLAWDTFTCVCSTMVLEKLFSTAIVENIDDHERASWTSASPSVAMSRLSFMGIIRNLKQKWKSYKHSPYCALEDLYVILTYGFIDEADTLLYRPSSLPKNQESIEITIENLQSLVEAWSVVDENLASRQEMIRRARDCINICTRIYSALQGPDRSPGSN
jgi:hypothetical protein